jgi:hypothetical protein
MSDAISIMAREWGCEDAGRDWLHYLEDIKTTVKTRQAEKRRASQKNTSQNTAATVSMPSTTPQDTGTWLEQTDNALNSLWKR